MALYQFLCASMVMVLLSSRGSHSQLLACGQAFNNDKIVGGQNASPGSWPWQVVLTSNGMPICAGSLIHHEWVMTAAHCLTGGDVKTTKAVMGRISHSTSTSNEETRDLERIECHPSYNFMTNDNDICLLKLSAPVNFTQYIQPVCLASATSTFHTGVMSWVTGFGYTDADAVSPSDILQEVDVPIVGNNQCRCTYPFLTDNMICAGHQEGGKDACLGDSGGPLVTKKGSIWVQSGIVSFGDGCAEPMIPGGYIRVSRYQEWISMITGDSEPGFVTYVSSGEDSDINFSCSKSLINIPSTSTTTTKTTTSTTPTTTTTSTTPTTTDPTTTTTSTTPTTTDPTTTTTSTTPTTTDPTTTTTSTTPATTTQATTTTSTTPTTTTTTTKKGGKRNKHKLNKRKGKKGNKRNKRKSDKRNKRNKRKRNKNKKNKIHFRSVVKT